jgi:hypothetical protein
MIGLRAARIKMVPAGKSIVSHMWGQLIDVIYGPVFVHYTLPMWYNLGAYYL